ncbi:hypothetical protein [Cryptosporangium arvum]|uniref:hypothetical protein n=1 Tax=Cryptosporangium arvum TaxID=80871 RepID=UPI0004B9A480|nr:hypothetical protein [Cryptosporangium arvum]
MRRELERLVVEREMRSILDATDDTYGGPVSALAVVTPGEAAELRRVWLALLAPYVARTGTPPDRGQRPTWFFLAATPLPDADRGGESE